MRGDSARNIRNSFTRKNHNKDYPYDDLGPLPEPLPMPINGMPIDQGIERLVRILRYNGVQTDQSCEGGEGHSSREPVVRFNGVKGEALRALGIAITYGFHVMYLRHTWHVSQGEIEGEPQWEIILYKKENTFKG